MGNDPQSNGQGTREWPDHSLKDISESFRRRAFARPRPDASADVLGPAAKDMGDSETWTPYVY